jgi:hypothetical protein
MLSTPTPSSTDTVRPSPPVNSRNWSRTLFSASSGALSSDNCSCRLDHSWGKRDSHTDSGAATAARKQADRDDEQDHDQRGREAGPHALVLKPRGDGSEHQPKNDAKARRRKYILAGMEGKDSRDETHHYHRHLCAAQQEKLDVRLGRQPDDRRLLGNAIGHENFPIGTKSWKRPLTFLCSRRNLAIHAALNARKRKE